MVNRPPLLSHDRIDLIGSASIGGLPPLPELSRASAHLGLLGLGAG
jgi:hypothetical protein